MTAIYIPLNHRIILNKFYCTHSLIHMIGIPIGVPNLSVSFQLALTPHPPGMNCKRSTSPEPLALPEAPDPLGQSFLGPAAGEETSEVCPLCVQNHCPLCVQNHVTCCTV